VPEKGHLQCAGHPGIRAMKRLIGAHFVWRGMASDIKAWCRECQQCARSKIHVHVKSPVGQIGVQQARFSHVHIDMGLLPTTPEDYTHLLTMIDRTTRWPEVVQLCTTSAVECADAFAAMWVARFGVPAQITTDRGTQFTTWRQGRERFS
jgi:IS30 family transposase